MEPTDEMVEALFGALGFDKAQPNGPDAVTRAVLGNALRAALAVMPGQYRVGWIAGRDAAAAACDTLKLAAEYGHVRTHYANKPNTQRLKHQTEGMISGFIEAAKTVRNMEPPA